MLTVGLTGGIGSGKSTVEKLFQAHGITVVDADEIAHRLVDPGQPALQLISDQFGQRVLTNHGHLDRNALREIIYSDPEAKKKLESILHPMVYDRIRRDLDRSTSAYGIASVPLLIETGHQHEVDRILVIDCSVETQIQRILQRDPLDPEQIQRIIAAQCSREDRLKWATDVITNESDLSDLKKQVDQLHQQFVSLASDVD